MKANLKICLPSMLLLGYQRCLLEADPTEDWVKSHSEFFEQAPKFWFAYIQSFFYLVQTQARYKDIQVNVKSLYIFVQQYKKRNMSLLFHRALIKAHASVLASLQANKKRVLSFGLEVTWLQGEMQLSSDLMHVTILHQNTKQCKNHFATFDPCIRNHRPLLVILVRFQLSTKLAVNFTFHSLEFVSGSVNFAGGQVACQLGQVCIVPINNTSGLQFCGHLSNFSVFPEFNNVDFNVLAFPSTVFHLVVTYMMMDTGLVQSITSLHSWGSINCVAKTAYVGEYEVHILEILERIVKKTEKISLLFDLDDQVQVQVFDGPGYLSKQSDMSSNVSRLSSFAALLTVYNNCTVETNAFFFKYTTSSATIRRVNVFQPKLFHSAKSF